MQMLHVISSASDKSWAYMLTLMQLQPRKRFIYLLGNFAGQTVLKIPQFDVPVIGLTLSSPDVIERITHMVSIVSQPVYSTLISLKQHSEINFLSYLCTPLPICKSYVKTFVRVKRCWVWVLRFCAIYKDQTFNLQKNVRLLFYSYWCGYKTAYITKEANTTNMGFEG